MTRLSSVTEIDREMIAVDTWEHYAEHAGEIERWLGHLPLHLHAEHGLWSRTGPGQPWLKGLSLRDTRLWRTSPSTRR